MKKTIASLIILALFALVLFFFGWSQYAVPAGSYGVIVSKTSGVDPEPLVPGAFRWDWERLLPTNATIIVFNLAPISKRVSLEGTLPSSELYSKMLEGNPDFSWKASFEVTGRVQPSVLPSLVSKNDIRDQKALAAWTDATLSAAAEKGIRSAIRAMTDAESSGAAEATGAAKGDSPDSLIEADVIAYAAKEGLEITSVVPVSFSIPDISLYVMGEKAYIAYQERKRALLDKTAEKEADASVSDYLQIERFAHLGEILTKYPILIEYIAVSGEGPAEKSLERLKAVRDLH